MVPSKSSHDADGFFDDDELDDLLRAEPFDDTNPDSDGSDGVVYSRAPRRLTHRQRRIVQSYPVNSHVGQIIKRLEKEGTALPCYLFWPWPKIRAFVNLLLLLVLLVVVAAPIWSMVQLVTRHPECMVSLNRPHVASGWWSDGPWVRIDRPPNASSAFVDEHAAVLGEYGIQTVWLASREWSADIGFNLNSRLTTESTGFLADASRVAHERGFKLIMSFYAVEVICQLDSRDKKCATPAHHAPVGTTSTPHADAVDSTVNWEALFSSLVEIGVDGFFLADLKILHEEESEHILSSISQAVGNDSSTEIISATDTDLPDTAPWHVRLVTVDVVSRPTSAIELSDWVQGLYNTSRSSQIIRLFVPASHKGDMTDLNMMLLTVLLPGVPMLDLTSVEGLTSGNSDEQTQLGKILQLRKNSATLHGHNFTIFEDHLKGNVFAMLRMYKEEKRYLVLWNFNNFTVSLDFNQLSMRGSWVSRSALLQHVGGMVNLRFIDDLRASEVGIIELP